MALTGILHGVIWKLAALLSKLGILVVIAPHLSVGEFANYLFVISCTQLAARLLANGAEDQLPLIIQQKPPANQYAATALLSLCATVLITVGAILLTLPAWMLAIAATFSFFSVSYSSGIARKISAASFEQLHNAPGILFFISVLIFTSNTSHQLILIQVLSNIAINLWIILKHRSYFTTSVTFKNITLYYKEAGSAGFQKMLSSFSQLLLMRGFIVLPPLFGIQTSDSLAFAVSLAEGFWQILVVMSVRNYVKYLNCNTHEASKIFRNSSIIYLSLTLFAFVCILFAKFCGLEQLINLNNRIDYQLTAGMALFYGSLVPILESRYLAWAQRTAPYKHTALFLVFIIPMALVIKCFDQAQWPQYFGVLFFLSATVYVILRNSELAKIQAK